MLDSIRLYTKIYQDNINITTWEKDIKKGEIYYYTFVNGVWLAYYPLTHSLIISGRILRILHNERSRNLDDIFSTASELTEFFCSINRILNQYIVNKKLDVMKMRITKIDYCFNVDTEFVDEYITLFNLYYKYNKDGKFSRYKNYVFEKNLPYNSSFYLKTNKDYNERTRKNFVINFYNKKDQLINQRKKDIATKGYSSITDDDIIEAIGILRLEVQVCYITLRKFCKKHHIPLKSRCLYDLLDISIAKDVLEYEIKRFFTLHDFYSYDRIVKLLKEQGYKANDKIFEYVYNVSHHKKTSTYRRYENILKDLDIFPYMFIPTKFKIDRLKNPMKLINEKIRDNNLEGLKLKREGRINENV